LEHLISVENLKMYYETLRGWVKAVDDISFTVDKGDAIGLAGESGCGKTSAALSILKLLPSNAKIVGGKIMFHDTDIVKLSDKQIRESIRWKKISMIFQGAMNALHPTKSIGDQIQEAIVAHEKVGEKDAWDRAGKLLDLVGIGAPKADRFPHELSGGMKQRAMTAMSLACNPDLVIADEPTTALDVIIEAQVLKVMKELREKLHLSMILISHDLSMIAETCNKIAIMYAGKIVEQGDIVSIYKDALHPYTQKLLSAFPSILGRKTELSSIHGFPPDLLYPPSGCRFHPRCEYAMEICKAEEPPLISVGTKDHTVSCHLVSR
jgi:peptide/nickel transport system ATP-binding protein